MPKVNYEKIITKQFSSTLKNGVLRLHSTYPRRMKCRGSIPSPYGNGRDFIAMAAGLAKQVMSYPVLKQVWIDETGSEGDAFAQLVNDNLYFFNKTGFNNENVVTPGGIYLYLNHAFCENDNFLIGFYLDELADSIFPAILYIFFCFDEADVPVYSHTEIIKTPGEDQIYLLDFRLPEPIPDAAGSYPHPMIYIALTAMKPCKEKIYWSATGAVRFGDP
jgi:hypothetical protein